MTTDVKIESYANCSEHLLAYLGLLDLYLLSTVQEMRQALESDADGDFRGLYVSENDVNTILSKMPYLSDRVEAGQRPLTELIDIQMQEITLRTQLSCDESLYLPLEDLRLRLALSNAEVLVLLLTLAPEIDLRYETLYSYIQQDVSRRSPSVDLALSMFCRSWEERNSLRVLITGESPLVKQGFISVSEDSHTQSHAILNKALFIEGLLVNFLLAQGDESQSLPGSRGALSWDDVVLDNKVKEGLISATRQLKKDEFDRIDAVIQLVGEAGTGKKLIASAMCQQLHRPIMVIDSEAVASSETSVAASVSSAFRKALLHNEVVCITNFHLLLQDDAPHKSLLSVFVKAIVDRRDLTFVTGETAWRVEGLLPSGVPSLTFSIPSPEYQDRQTLWELYLDGHNKGLSDSDIRTLAGRFRLRGGQIQMAVETAKNMSLFHGDLNGMITLEDLNTASRWHSNQGLSRLAQKIEPNYLWDDIVLPLDQKSQLGEICSYFSNMALVYDDWGFQSKTNLGKGLNVLFAGASGTGKTMAADVMAGQLGLDLYKIDLSSMVSKYIGETEKNLDRIFREAEDSNAILFFDEADALFGKRSEVKDAHDRYANIETSYLLQKMEEFQGIVILATNFRMNMDEAFTRRMHFVIEFPVPDETDRLKIWNRVFPESAPKQASLDLGFMAKQFKMAGGNIKNVAVTSAFLAAQANESIDMKHVILATKREYQKMGKLMVEGEFGPYFELVKAKPTNQTSAPIRKAKGI